MSGHGVKPAALLTEHLPLSWCRTEVDWGLILPPALHHHPQQSWIDWYCPAPGSHSYLRRRNQCQWASKQDWVNALTMRAEHELTCVFHFHQIFSSLCCLHARSHKSLVSNNSSFGLSHASASVSSKHQTMLLLTSAVVFLQSSWHKTVIKAVACRALQMVSPIQRPTEEWERSFGGFSEEPAPDPTRPSRVWFYPQSPCVLQTSGIGRWGSRWRRVLPGCTEHQSAAFPLLWGPQQPRPDDAKYTFCEVTFDV